MQFIHREAACAIEAVFLKRYLLCVFFAFFLYMPWTYADDAKKSNNSTKSGGSVASNPADVNYETGTGELGKLIGFTDKSGIRIGAAWAGDTNYLFCGGAKPHKWSGNSLFILDLKLDLDILLKIPGASVGAQFLQFNGSSTNVEAGTVQGYNSLPGSPPLTRTELYQLWWRQELFNQKLIIRLGKSCPNFDFNNVISPIPYSDPTKAIPVVTSVIYTTIFVNGSMLGVLPGYYNSAVGITVSFTPTEHYFLTAGCYDGSGATGRQTGIKDPRFKEYYFSIAETGFTWEYGPQKMPGKFGIGAWNQSGLLKIPNVVTQKGTQGVYLYGSQRLWFQHPGKDDSGILGFFQYGINNSKVLPITAYAGGGLTALGLVGNRKDDSFGFGFAYSKLNRRLGFRPSELLLQGYYQAKLSNNFIVEPVLTYIPTPGASIPPPASNPSAAPTTLKPAWAATVRLIALF